MSEKLLQQRLAIAKQEQPSSLAIVEEQEKKVVLSDYLEKYGAITGRAITPQVMQIYWEALQDLPLNRLRAGLREWLETGDRWPWPAQIREAGEL